MNPLDDIFQVLLTLNKESRFLFCASDPVTCEAPVGKNIRGLANERLHSVCLSSTYFYRC